MKKSTPVAKAKVEPDDWPHRRDRDRDPRAPTEMRRSSSPRDDRDELKNCKTLSCALDTDLKELLIQVTRKTDLAGVAELKLKVVSEHARLHRLSDYAPRLKILILDGSCVASLRDLGSSLESLTTLSVARCDVRELDGVAGFPSLEDLNARENLVRDPSPCSSVRRLSRLDLRRNQVADVSYFGLLRSCRRLRELDLDENHISDYREEMRTLLPRLRVLDGEELTPDRRRDRDPASEEDPSSEDESPTRLSVRSVELIVSTAFARTTMPREGDGEEEEKENRAEAEAECPLELDGPCRVDACEEETSKDVDENVPAERR